MYTVTKRLEVSAAHSLNLSYESKCTNSHGHNWIIYVTCAADKLNMEGMVIDFTEIKKIVHGRMDHQNLNAVFDFQPTAENIARWIVNSVPFCIRAEIHESEGNVAIYEKIPDK
jgi:6-pyruvoyltetrahydropterin/6-carboxytetrahydropterin synthase